MWLLDVLNVPELLIVCCIECSELYIHNTHSFFFKTEYDNVGNGVTLPTDGVMECIHISSQHHCIGSLVHKWKSIGWNSVYMWKYELFVAEMHKSAMQSCVKHWLIMPSSTIHWQSGYKHSKAEDCQLPACIRVNVLYPFTQTCEWP